MKEWYDGLAERERRLLLMFAGVLVAFVLFLIPYGTSAMLDTKREANDQLRDAVRTVQANRARLAQQQQSKEAIEARYNQKAPALAGFIENAARQSDLEIPESQDRADIPRGKRFVERSTVVRMRKVNMLPLLRMLERIEQSGYAVIISRLNIRKRGASADEYDVELGLSAFDRLAKKSATQGDAGAPAETEEEKP